MTNKPMLSVERELLERAASAIEKHYGSLQWVIASELRALLNKEVDFLTPDCPDCACVQDGQCLCIPSKPAALQQDEPVALLSKGFTTLESEGGKYRIITAYENRDDAWEDYKELCNAEQPYSAVNAELKAELEKYKAGCVDLSSQVRELEHKMDFYRNDEVKEELEAYKVAFEEGKKAAMYHSGSTLIAYMEVMGKLQRDIIRERKEKGA